MKKESIVYLYNHSAPGNSSIYIAAITMSSDRSDWVVGTVYTHFLRKLKTILARRRGKRFSSTFHQAFILLHLCDRLCCVCCLHKHSFAQHRIGAVWSHKKSCWSPPLLHETTKGTLLLAPIVTFDHFFQFIFVFWIICHHHGKTTPLQAKSGCIEWSIARPRKETPSLSSQPF